MCNCFYVHPPTRVRVAAHSSPESFLSINSSSLPFNFTPYHLLFSMHALVLIFLFFPVFYPPKQSFYPKCRLARAAIQLETEQEKHTCKTVRIWNCCLLASLLLPTFGKTHQSCGLRCHCSWFILYSRCERLSRFSCAIIVVVCKPDYFSCTLPFLCSTSTDAVTSQFRQTRCFIHKTRRTA